MKDSQLHSLQTKALECLCELEKLTDLIIVHFKTDVVPSTKARVFKFFAAKKGTPNDPQYEIVIDERGSSVNLDNLSKQEGTVFFVGHDLKIDIDRSKLLPAEDSGEGIVIDPDTNEWILKFGDKETEIITVKIPKGWSTLQKVDIYFLADTTGSMRPVIDEIKRSSEAILTALSDLGEDIAFGVGSYKDFPSRLEPDDIPFGHQLNPTTIIEDVQAAINAWSVGGGSDRPESQLFALDQIARGSNIRWRSDSKRIIVWFGDEPGHEPVCQAISGLTYDIDVNYLEEQLDRRKFTVIAISTTTGNGLDADPTIGAVDYEVCGEPGGTPSQATNIARATDRGDHILGIEPVAIANAIINALTTVFTPEVLEDVHLDTEDNIDPFVSVSPQEYIADELEFQPGTDELILTFEVDFEGVIPCKAGEDQTFRGNISVVVNDNTRTSKSVTITVPKCDIVGSPSAVVSIINRHPRKNQINVFVPGQNNNLLWCSNNNKNPEEIPNWTWGNLEHPDNTGVSDSNISTPYAIATEEPNFSMEFIRAFAKGEDGNLYEIFRNDSQWTNWNNHGIGDLRANMMGSPTVIMAHRVGYYEEEGYITNDEFLAFIWRTDGNLVHYSNSLLWRFQGRPDSDVQIVSSPGVVSQNEYIPDNRIIHVFVIGDNNELYASISIPSEHFGLSWMPWLSLGKPNENTNIAWWHRPGVTVFNFEGKDWIYTFVAAGDHLWVYRWQGAIALSPENGSWHDLGAPSGVKVRGATGVITYEHAGKDQIYVFIRGDDNNLYTCFWDASNVRWVWKNLDKPTNATVKSNPAVVTWEHENQDPIYVFVRGNDDQLHMCHLDSGITDWQWKELS